MRDSALPTVRRSIPFGFGLLVFTLSAALVIAQTPSKETPPASTAKSATESAEMAAPLTAADKKFIKDASEALYLELSISEIAIRRNRPVGASVDAARKAGDLVHDDLKKVWEELSAVARAKNEKVRDELTGVEKREAEQLRSLDVDKFNKQVVAMLGKESKTVAQIFATKSIQHPALRTIIERHSPTLTKHAAELPQVAK